MREKARGGELGTGEEGIRRCLFGTARNSQPVKAILQLLALQKRHEVSRAMHHADNLDSG